MRTWTQVKQRSGLTLRNPALKVSLLCLVLLTLTLIIRNSDKGETEIRMKVSLLCLVLLTLTLIIHAWMWNLFVMKFELSSDVHVMSLSLCWYRIINFLDVFVLLKLITLKLSGTSSNFRGSMSSDAFRCCCHGGTIVLQLLWLLLWWFNQQTHR